LGQKTKVRVKDSHESKPDRGSVRIRGLEDVPQVCQTLPSVEKVTTLNAVVDGGDWEVTTKAIEEGSSECKKSIRIMDQSIAIN